MLTTEKCPCGKALSYSDCCEPYHKEEKIALTAEVLMRSRYSAFAKNKVDFLIKTHHKSTKHVLEIQDLELFCKKVSFVKLRIIKTKMGGELDDKGTVKFKAYYEENGLKSCISENSTFEKIDGAWFYKSGIQ